MVAKKLPGSHLLAALHAGMERMKTCLKVCRATSKKPQNRSNLDINYILAETQAVQLLTQHGPGVHRDLCHVVQHCSLPQMSSFRMPGEHPHGLLIYVMQGRIQVRTRSQFKPALSADDSNNSSKADGSSKAAHHDGGNNGTSGSAEGNSSAAGASEADLRALFDSIDVDGSGAIDVEELQYALELMGIQKTASDVQELMDSVDKDGSGELEFDEFVLILTTKLGVGQQKQATWQQLADGTWALEVRQGTCLGAAALTQGLAQEGLVVAMDDSDLLLLDGNVYSNILSTGFDGQLTAKMNVVRSCPAFIRSLSAKSDLRGLAYVATAETFSWGSRIYAAGQPCQKGAVYIIQEGSCRVVGRVKCTATAPMTTAAAMLAAAEAAGGGSTAVGADSSPAAATAALLASPRHGLHTPRSRVSEQQVELAVVGPGAIIGEGALLGLATQPNSAVVSSAYLSALKLQVADMQQLMHPADLQALQECLRQRDADRTHRLAAAASTTSALHTQQQHVRGVAAASAAAAAAAGAEQQTTTTGASSLLQDGQLSPRQRGPGTPREWDSPRGARTGFSSSGGGAAANGACVTGEAAMRLLLPSSGASAAAAIAARGEVNASKLPSRAAKAEANAVTQLLTDLVGAEEDMQAAQAAVIAATAAALSASGHSSADVFSLAGCSMFGGTATDISKRLAQTTPGALRGNSMGNASAAAAAAAFASAPGAVAGASGLIQQQQQEQQHGQFTAAHTLLPDRLVAKLQHAVSDTQMGSRSPRCQHAQHLQLPAVGPLSARRSGSPHSSPHSRSEGGVFSGNSSSRQYSSNRQSSKTEGGAPSGGSSSSRQYSSNMQRSRTEGGLCSPRSPGCEARGSGGGASLHHHASDAKQQQQQQHTQALSPARLQSPVSPKSVKRGLAVAAACSSNQPDLFFLQTGGACVGAAMQVGQVHDDSSESQHQQQGEQGAGSGERQRSRTQEEQPGGSFYLTGPAPIGLPVLAPDAIAMAQQQLATCSISLPTARSSRHRTPVHTPCSAAGSVAVVSMALTSEAAAAAAAAGVGLDGVHRRESSTAMWPAVSPGRLKSCSCKGAATARNSTGGAAAATLRRVSGAQGTAVAASSPGRSSVAQLYNVYVGGAAGGTGGGRLSSAAPDGGQETARTWGPATGRGTMKHARWSMTGPGADTELGSSAHSSSAHSCSGSSSSRAGAQGADHAAAQGAVVGLGGLHCTPARPVPGGVFVELDGPAWDAAESAADTASWCLSSRSRRQRQGITSPRHQQGQQLQVTEHLQGPLQGASPDTGHSCQAAVAVLQAAAPGSTDAVQLAGGSRASSTAALLVAAEDLLSKPLPPGSLGSRCRPTSGPLSPTKTAQGPHWSEDGGAGAHADQELRSPKAQACNTGSAAGKGQPALATSPNRRVAVPKLQLATLQLQLQTADCAVSPGGPFSPIRCSTTATGICSSTVYSPRVGTAGGAAGAGLPGLDEQVAAQQGGLPPALPAFTPRRVWAPGGSRPNGC